MVTSILNEYSSSSKNIMFKKGWIQWVCIHDEYKHYTTDFITMMLLHIILVCWVGILSSNK